MTCRAPCCEEGQALYADFFEAYGAMIGAKERWDQLPKDAKDYTKREVLSALIRAQDQHTVTREAWLRHRLECGTKTLATRGS